jgi:hypothetical protein
MDWVVTYQVHFPDQAGVGLQEFYRGPKEECLRIMRGFAGGTDDRCKTRWGIIVGRADNWDRYLRENAVCEFSGD